ncbi:MAG: nitronate monooxygenase [Hyphomicrobiales bacterium]|nr:nitronate monooxygenase [Hyphomicrobiales bacterium]MBV8663078.1 nitronate monooxygenase [Hyphomicrobiales bacterium]
MTTTSPARQLLELLGIDHPIIQAPMAGTSTPKMAAAVSNAGGLGSIGLGAMTANAAGEAMKAFREQSQRSLNVNVFCHQPAKADPVREAAWIEKLRPEFEKCGAQAPGSLNEIYKSFLVDEAMFTTILAQKPRVVSFHFGLPGEAWIRALREAGVILLATATSPAEARTLVAAGVHAIVAQGYEAGGHRGIFAPDGVDDKLGTFALTRLLAREFAVPVIAAGGIMDGAGIAAALRLGAAAAQLGTAFVACNESAADEAYRQTLFSEAAQHTVMARVISGRPARCLANRFTALEAKLSQREVPAYPIAYDAAKTLNAAAKAAGEHGFGAQWAGQGAPLARSLPAAKMVEALVQELNAS